MELIEFSSSLARRKWVNLRENKRNWVCGASHILHHHGISENMQLFFGLLHKRLLVWIIYLIIKYVFVTDLCEFKENVKGKVKCCVVIADLFP